MIQISPPRCQNNPQNLRRTSNTKGYKMTNTKTHGLFNNERIDSETKIITRLRTKYISTLTPNECNNQNHTLTVTAKVIDSPQDPPFPSKEQYWLFQALY